MKPTVGACLNIVRRHFRSYLLGIFFRAQKKPQPKQGLHSYLGFVLLSCFDEPEIFFIQRAEYEGDPWSGQIAFPGGRATLMETAPGVSVQQVLDLTDAELIVPDKVPEMAI